MAPGENCDDPAASSPVDTAVPLERRHGGTGASGMTSDRTTGVSSGTQSAARRKYTSAVPAPQPPPKINRGWTGRGNAR